MIYQTVVALLLALFLLNLTLNLLALRLPRRKRLAAPPPVSVIVPARDEAGNIEVCLRSLLQQDYPNFEVIVLNDNSSDATPQIVSEMAARDGRLRLLTGQALPPGWAGKPFACYQGARAARGEWLLFVDADTRHAPGMLSRLIPVAVETDASMLSGFPRELTPGPWPRMALPFMYLFLCAWAPLWWLARRREPTPTVAIGQFILFPRAAYWRMDGHAAVKGRIIEDMWLGLEVTRRGGREVTFDLSPVVSCQMYRGLPDTWEGITKWTYSVASLSPAALLLLILLAVAVFFLPFYWLLRAVGDAPRYGNVLPLVVLQLGLLFAMRALVDGYFRESPLALLLHPLGLIFWVLAGLNGLALRLSGAGVTWKKRVYGRASHVE